MIMGYVGEQGSGKTYWLTRDAIRAFDLGMLVVSNYEILDPATGKGAHVVDLTAGLGPLYEFGEQHRDQGVLAVVTEIGQLMPARMWQQTTTFRLINELAQTRKRKMHLHWDAQHISMVDKLIRANTGQLWDCAVVFRNPLRRDDGAALDLETGRKPLRPWRLRADRFKVRHLEADPSDDTKEKRRLERRRAWFSDRIARAYDTYEIHAAHAAKGTPAALRPADRDGDKSVWLPTGTESG